MAALCLPWIIWIRKSIARKLIQDLDEKKRCWLTKFQTQGMDRFLQPTSPTRLMHRGDPLSPREVVSPVSLSAFTQRVPEYALDKNSPENKDDSVFAEWLSIQGTLHCSRHGKPDLVLPFWSRYRGYTFRF